MYIKKPLITQRLKVINYAQGRIRTCTWKSIQRPERCASANSATWAKLMRPQGVEP